MERPTFDVLGFLHEPARPASVATVSGRGRPALATASATYRLWSMSPDRGMAVAYPGLNDGPTFRWSAPSALFRS